MLLSFMIILTSLSGFLRYRVLANYFNKNDLDIFLASFRLPDLIYEILITGAITSTFIPIYVLKQGLEKYQAKQGCIITGRPFKSLS